MKAFKKISRHKEFISLAFLTILSLILIFYKNAEIPKHLAIDEVAFTKIALSLDNKPYSPYSPLETGHSTTYFYLILASLKIFGINTFALRLPSAIFGILNILIFFFITKKIFKNYLLSSILTVVFLTSRWYINFARFSYEATFLLFLELCSIFLFLKFLEKKGSLTFCFSALFAGLAFSSYLPGRLFFILPCLFLLLYEKKKYLFQYLLIVFVVAFPLLFYLAFHPDLRIKEVSITSNKKISSYEKTKQIAENLKKITLMFNFAGDMNGRHNYPGKPALNPIFGFFFIAGLAIALKNINNRYNQIFLVFFFVSVIPTLFTLTSENPNMLRTFTVLSSLTYFSGLTISYILNFEFKIRKKFLIGIIFSLVAISSFYELRTYFLFQSRVFRNSFEITCPLKDVLKYEVKRIPLKCRVSKNLF